MVLNGILLTLVVPIFTHRLLSMFGCLQYCTLLSGSEHSAQETKKNPRSLWNHNQIPHNGETDTVCPSVLPSTNFHGSLTRNQHHVHEPIDVILLVESILSTGFFKCDLRSVGCQRADLRAFVSAAALQSKQSLSACLQARGPVTIAMVRE
ncbi:uncharacterized protein YALI1_C14332g [Yarrowia lipolytica]|uniref:Secreted protein n=1 Tax=Yarrowia lipolytica TaxID=4952 RepID=A0A1D8NAG7_YARLL|nr:hypothetical protein YALI1_C14332g [Yarrowia lipolytica]